jgi:16S rRNA U516 pseudouridylate synthase RsuA-like enzyme
MEIRIQKHLSEQGICSRREAERFIAQGLVYLNGVQVREFGVKVDPLKDKVEVRDSAKRALTTYAVHKKSDTESLKTVSQKPLGGHFFVDELPKTSSGILLYTNDSRLKKALQSGGDCVATFTVFTQESIVPAQIEEACSSGRRGEVVALEAKRLDAHELRIKIPFFESSRIRELLERVRLTPTKIVRSQIGAIKFVEGKQAVEIDPTLLF